MIEGSSRIVVSAEENALAEYHLQERASRSRVTKAAAQWVGSPTSS
jgi:hypothetical protein